MNIEKILQDNLKKHLQSVCPKHWFKDVYEYAVLPPGKLFRPQLVYAIEKDFQNSATFSNDPHAILASAIEIHHTYTLIHDDLPCMDDDEYRRGRLCTHKKFGEWEALLAGDGLLNGSYQLISKIKSPELFRYFSWCVGSRGLIQGQVLDLAEEMNKSFECLLETHKLKTARLIQTSIVGSYILTTNSNLKQAKILHRFGHQLGLVFQFLDDLSELTDIKLSEHELTINPWIRFPEKSLDTLINGLDIIASTIKCDHLNSTHQICSRYFTKMKSAIFSNLANIQKHFSGNLDDIESKLNSLTSSYDSL